MTPLLMGILNVTPDSFSDGGAHFSMASAIEAGLRMADEGADVIDVGGESTRPGAEPVAAEEELERILAVVERLAAATSRVSVDTSKAAVAEATLQAGAWMVNDVTALSDPRMADVCARASCQVCLMHMQGTPQTMQQAPAYHDVVAEVRAFLLERADYAQANGIKRENIWIDPGIGFGKTVEHNLSLLRHLDALVETGYKVLIGVSRKSFLGRIQAGEGCEPVRVDQRLHAGVAVQVLAQAQGVAAIRTHDVAEARAAIDAAAAILGQ